MEPPEEGTLLPHSRSNIPKLENPREHNRRRSPGTSYASEDRGPSKRSQSSAGGADRSVSTGPTHGIRPAVRREGPEPRRGEDQAEKPCAEKAPRPTSAGDPLQLEKPHSGQGPWPTDKPLGPLRAPTNRRGGDADAYPTSAARASPVQAHTKKVTEDSPVRGDVPPVQRVTEPVHGLHLQRN